MSNKLKVEFIDNSSAQYDENAARIRVKGTSESGSSKQGKLYLGDQFANSFVQIKARKIKAVVCCSYDMFGFCKENEVDYCKVDPEQFEDDPKIFDTCYDFIDKKLTNGKNVVVTCETGRGNSALFVIYYLMKKHSVNLEDTVKLVEGLRSPLKLRPSLCKIALKLEKQLFGSNSMYLDGKVLESTSKLFKLKAEMSNNGKSASAISGLTIVIGIVMFFGAVYGVLYALTEKP